MSWRSTDLACSVICQPSRLSFLSSLDQRFDRTFLLAVGIVSFQLRRVRGHEG